MVMKKTLRTLIVVAMSAMNAVTLGCASTDTRESTGEMVDSSVITANVKAALAGEDVKTLLRLEVETFRDTVQLSGFVNTEEEKTMAGDIAKGVGGVTKVENNLMVKPEA